MQGWEPMHGHAAAYGFPPAAYMRADLTSIPPLHHFPHHHNLHHPAAGSLTAHNKSILELRKEKSRDAARSRRGKENYEFYELAKMLPLPAAITSQLDKASIIRLTISYLKLRDFSSHGDPPWNRDGPPPNKSVKESEGWYQDRIWDLSQEKGHYGGPPRRRSMTAVAMEIFETHQGTHILQSIDGFVFALANDGRFLYISETVSIYLGLSQVEMTGSSVFDYIHVQDHSELAEHLGLVLPQAGAVPSPGSASDEGSSSSTPRAASPPIPERAIMNPNPNKGYDRTFCIRMKSTLTKRGVHVKCSGFRVVQILCHMRPQFSFSLTRKHPPPLLGLVAMAVALPPPTISELLIDNDMFVTRLSPEFKVIYCEPRISDLMDISADDLTNKNLYDYCHAEDLQKVRKSHVDLLNKGQVLTDYYRLLNKHGGWVWVQTCATIICNAKNAEDQNIIAINYVLSGIEYGGCVMDTNQLKVAAGTEPDQSDHSESDAGSDHEDKKDERERKSPFKKEDPEDRDRRRGRKRRHSSEDDPGTAQDVVEPGSPDTTLSMLYTGASQSEDAPLNHLYTEETKFNGADKIKTVDTKNSRRKMDRPRKRKRESDSETDGVEVDTVSNLDSLLNGGDSDTLVETVATANRTSALTAPSPPGGATVGQALKSPAPEDLSVRNSTPVRVVQSPQPAQGAVTPNTNSESSLDKWHHSHITSTGSDTFPATTVTSSVRDLEEVMNKHLPALPSDAEHLRAGFHTDYTSSIGFHQKHKSAIQWIGSQHTTGTETLPATNLLRTLYANRESVIRTNVYNPRPQYSYGDMQPSLLTPPGQGTEAYKDTSPFSTQQGVSTTPKTPPTTYSLMPGYTGNPITVAMSTNMADTYNMTPPSSVSPQDKYTLPFSAEQCHSEAQYRAYAADGASHLPIKPQAYPLPAHANAHMSSAYDRTAAQYSATGYYGHTGAYPTYNHAASPTPAHYRDVTKNGNVW